jgi:hypothetical protein
MNILTEPGRTRLGGLSGFVRDAVDALKHARVPPVSPHGFVIGYKSVILPYQPSDRIRQSKIFVRKDSGWRWMPSFLSLVPLYIGISLGALMICLALLE